MRYLEDVPVNEEIELGRVVADRDEIIAFATTWDPQFFHIDETAAVDGPFGGLVASGMHTLVMCMRLYVSVFLLDLANLGGQGIDELHFLAPVRPGDELVVTLEVTEARPSERKPDRGTMTVLIKARNQDGDPVLSTRSRTRMGRRPDGVKAA